MNDDLRRLVETRLEQDGVLGEDWSLLVLAACEGASAVEGLLNDAETPPSPLVQTTAQQRTGTYLASLTVQGFRGIGPRQTLELAAGPGLTLIVGRNGSGKSSFAEALEVLFTGDSRRWSERSKVWKEGWRSLHQAHPAYLEAEVLLDGQGPATVVRSWNEGAAFEEQTAFVQPRGKSRTSAEALGWKDALRDYRPFLSYNELGSILDEGPAKLHDALSDVLGLGDLVAAQEALVASRKRRQQVWDAADQGRKELVGRLKVLAAGEPDPRVDICLRALAAKPWGIAEIEQLVAAGPESAGADRTLAALRRVLVLEAGHPDWIQAAAAALRAAAAEVRSHAGSDAERARQLAELLESALAIHARHGGGDCPLCGTPAALSASWAETTRNEIDRLRAAAVASEQAHHAAQHAIRAARELLPLPPEDLLAALGEAGLDGLAPSRAAWTAWHAGRSITDPVALADHLEQRFPVFATALDALRLAAEAEIQRREDRWRPTALAIAGWLVPALDAVAGAESLQQIKAAEDWLKKAATEIRNARFAPIADQAMAIWEDLRQQSNVALGRIELVGAKTQRRVTLDVTVDGVPGAALGVMSQGELHSLALSLFLPRATLAASPFRFVAIDDPVQSMDPARVDGLAKVLAATARTRQVVVFTHDDRLPEAVRRLGLACQILGVTRRPGSIVEIRTALDPVRAHIEDALALVFTANLPQEVLRSVVPGFCRSALEAACVGAVRRRRLAAGRRQDEVEEELRRCKSLSHFAALALFDDAERGGDVMARLNQFGSWAGDVFRQAREGAHKHVAADMQTMVQHTEKLSAKLLELR